MVVVTERQWGTGALPLPKKAIDRAMARLDPIRWSRQSASPPKALWPHSPRSGDYGAELPMLKTAPKRLHSNIGRRRLASDLLS
jgi:hypothetical protein